MVLPPFRCPPESAAIPDFRQGFGRQCRQISGLSCDRLSRCWHYMALHRTVRPSRVGYVGIIPVSGEFPHLGRRPTRPVRPVPAPGPARRSGRGSTPSPRRVRRPGRGDCVRRHVRLHPPGAMVRAAGNAAAAPAAGWCLAPGRPRAFPALHNPRMKGMRPQGPGSSADTGFGPVRRPPCPYP